MVCESCEVRLKPVCVPDKWKDGARNVASSSSSSSSSSLKVGKTNKALANIRAGADLTPKNHICRICKSKVQPLMNYCNDCAHKKGICTMCGKKSVDVSKHNMKLV